MTDWLGFDCHNLVHPSKVDRVLFPTFSNLKTWKKLARSYSRSEALERPCRNGPGKMCNQNSWHPFWWLRWYELHVKDFRSTAMNKANSFIIKIIHASNQWNAPSMASLIAIRRMIQYQLFMKMFTLCFQRLFHLAPKWKSSSYRLLFISLQKCDNQ